LVEDLVTEKVVSALAVRVDKESEVSMIFIKKFEPVYPPRLIFESETDGLW
jgi:hypothetical protein